MKIQEQNCLELAVRSTCQSSNVRTHVVLILLSLHRIIQGPVPHLTLLQMFMTEGDRLSFLRPPFRSRILLLEAGPDCPVR